MLSKTYVWGMWRNMSWFLAINCSKPIGDNQNDFVTVYHISHCQAYLSNFLQHYWTNFNNVYLISDSSIPGDTCDELVALTIDNLVSNSLNKDILVGIIDQYIKRGCSIIFWFANNDILQFQHTVICTTREKYLQAILILLQSTKSDVIVYMPPNS